MLVNIKLFPDYPDVLSVELLCKALAIGKNTAYMLLAQKKIRSFRIGNVYKIPKQYLVEYILSPSNK